jgi:sugar phosphate isomerase/epimerase
MHRRAFLFAPLAGALFAETNRIDASRLSAITDEIGMSPLEAIAFARHYELKWVELRSVPGRGPEYAFLPDADVKAAAQSFREAGLRVSFLNTSLLKFPWPDTEPVRPRRGSAADIETQRQEEARRFARRMDDLRLAIRAAHLFDVRKIRVFCGMRVAEPRRLYPRIADVLGEMSVVAEREGVKLLIENEGACNVGTSAELAEILRLIPSPAVGANWDPHNDLGHRQIPFPDGYRLLPKERLGNVQVKGKSLLDPANRLDWRAIFAALERDGYQGQVGLETHYFDGSLIEKSHLSMQELLRIVKES